MPCVFSFQVIIPLLDDEYKINPEEKKLISKFWAFES